MSDRARAKWAAGPQSGVGAAVPLSVGGGAGSPSKNVAWAESSYLCTKWHLDPSNRLATIHQRHRETGQTGQRSRSIGRNITNMAEWICLRQWTTSDELCTVTVQHLDDDDDCGEDRLTPTTGCSRQPTPVHVLQSPSTNHYLNADHTLDCR